MKYAGICILLSFLPCMMGCEEFARANDGTPSSQLPSAGSFSHKENKKSLSLSDLPATDPLIMQAIEAKQLLVQQEEELLERLEGIRSLLSKANVDREKLRRSVEEFLQTVKDMRSITSKALESMHLLIEQTTHLQRTARHLGSSYRAAGDLFRKKARDYSEKRLRTQLEGFAKDYEEIAQSIPERLRTLQAFQKQLPQLRTKAREAQAFLDDVILYLSSHPGIGSNPTSEYATQFESFAATFSDWLRTLEEMRDSLRAQAISKVIQASFQQEQVAKAEEEAKRNEHARLEHEKRLHLAQEEQAKAAQLARQAEQAKKEELNRVAQFKREQEQLIKEKDELAKQRHAFAAEKARVQQGWTSPTVSPGIVHHAQPVTYYVQARPHVTYYGPYQPQWHPVPCR